MTGRASGRVRVGRAAALALAAHATSAGAQSLPLAARDSLDGAPRWTAELGVSVRTSLVRDFRGLQGSPTFNIVRIPPTRAPGDRDGRLFIDERQSRLRATTRVRTRELGAITAFVETDFQGPGGASTLRLRHAWVQVGRWRVGQGWSAFADADALPPTADVDGPPTGVAVRTAAVQWRGALGARGWRLAVSAESPRADVRVDSVFTGAAFGRADQGAPDLASHVRLERPWGTVQLAGIARALAYRAPDGGRRTALGRGVSVSAMVGTRDQLFAQAATGRGIQRYLTALSGVGADLVSLGDAGRLRPLATHGGSLGWSHPWSATLRSTLVVGTLQVPTRAPAAPPEGPPFRGTFWAVNAFWAPTRLLSVGPEVEYGTRVNPDGTRRDALRLTTLVRYGF